MERCIACVLALALASCTFDDGAGFATLERATLSVRWEPGAARDLGNATVLTDLGYQVALDSLTLGLEELRLEERRGGGDTTSSFDPAQPPAGFSLCHGGHCHADDGRLVSYEDIEAELGGGAATLVPVVALVIEQGVDLLADPVLRLERIEPSRELPMATLARGALVLRDLTIVASVSGARLTEVVPLQADVSALGAVSQRLDFAIDRDAPEKLALSAELTIDGTLFDGIEFAELTAGEALSLSELDDPTVLELAQNVLSSALVIRFVDLGD